MPDNKFNNCYKKILEKLDSMEENLTHLQENISELKKSYDEIEEEVCLDAIEADKAAYEAIREICIDSLLDVEPKGDA